MEKIELNSYLKKVNKSNINFNERSRNGFIDKFRMNSLHNEDNNMNYYNNNQCPISEQNHKRSLQSKFCFLDDQPKQSFSTTYMMNDIIKNKKNIDQLIHDKGSKLHGLSDNKVAIEFNPNLSFSLEENNWGYNFATRGLDLRNSWTNGHYIQSFAENLNAKSSLNISDSNNPKNNYKKSDDFHFY